MKFDFWTKWTTDPCNWVLNNGFDWVPSWKDIFKCFSNRDFLSESHYITSFQEIRSSNCTIGNFLSKNKATKLTIHSWTVQLNESKWDKITFDFIFHCFAFAAKHLICLTDLLWALLWSIFKCLLKTNLIYEPCIRATQRLKSKKEKEH